jgi:hypothetical protein
MCGRARQCGTQRRQLRVCVRWTGWRLRSRRVPERGAADGHPRWRPQRLRRARVALQQRRATTDRRHASPAAPRGPFPSLVRVAEPRDRHVAPRVLGPGEHAGVRLHLEQGQHRGDPPQERPVGARRGATNRFITYVFYCCCELRTGVASQVRQLFQAHVVEFVDRAPSHGRAPACPPSHPCHRALVSLRSMPPRVAAACARAFSQCASPP